MNCYEDRISYQDIKFELLDGFYGDLRNNVYSKKKFDNSLSYQELISKLYDDFEGTYELPIERIMMYVILIILSNYEGNIINFFLKEIHSILQINPELKELIKSLPNEEADKFKNDLELIGLHF